MPISIPQTDQRTYDDLRRDAMSTIPLVCPEWTDHNPSDPGMTLIEMFAYLTDLLLYRVNRISKPNLFAYLRLLNGPKWKPSKERTVVEEIHETVSTLRKIDRAVTPQDFQVLSSTANPLVAKALCVPSRNLESGNTAERRGHISVVILEKNMDPPSQPQRAVLKAVQDYLEPRRLLGSKLHIVGPRYVRIGLRLTVIPVPGRDLTDLHQRTQDRISTFFHPLIGGWDGLGWALGQSVFLSEVYRMLASQVCIHHIQPARDENTREQADALVVNHDESFRIMRNDQGDIVGVRLEPFELPFIDPSLSEIVYA